MSIDNICPACAATLMHILAYCGLGLPVAGHPGHRDQWGWAQSKQLIASITCVLHLACQRFPIRRVSHGEKRVGPENVQVKNRWACTVWVAALLAPGVVWVSPPPADHFFFFFFLLACPPSFREADLLALFVHLKEPALRTGSLVNDPSLVCQVPGTKTLSPALTTAVGSHAIFTQHQEVEILSNRLKWKPSVSSERGLCEKAFAAGAPTHRRALTFTIVFLRLTILFTTSANGKQHGGDLRRRAARVTAGGGDVALLQECIWSLVSGSRWKHDVEKRKIFTSDSVICEGFFFLTLRKPEEQSWKDKNRFCLWVPVKWTNTDFQTVTLEV